MNKIEYKPVPLYVTVNNEEPHKSSGGKPKFNPKFARKLALASIRNNPYQFRFYCRLCKEPFPLDYGIRSRIRIPGRDYELHCKDCFYLHELEKEPKFELK